MGLQQGIRSQVGRTGHSRPSFVLVESGPGIAKQARDRCSTSAVSTGGPLPGAMGFYLRKISQARKVAVGVPITVDSAWTCSQDPDF